MMHRRRCVVPRWVATVMALLAVLSTSSGSAIGQASLSDPPTRPRAAGPGAEAVSWLSTGDSYSSGEGISASRPTGGRCARSERAYGPRTARSLRVTHGWNVRPEVFSACTGARLVDFYGRPSGGGQSLWAMSRSDGPANGRFDVVTLSLGGNDLGFGEVIRDCIAILPTWDDVLRGEPDRCDEGLHRQIDLIDGFIDERGFGQRLPGSNESAHSLVEFYEHLIDRRLTRDGHLVVVGYPRLFAPSEDWGRWRGRWCHTMHADDADLLAVLGERLEARMREAVETADAGRGRASYVSRWDLFDEPDAAGRPHTLCGGGTEWINGLTLGTSAVGGNGLRPEASFHPNRLGHLRTAKELSRAVRDHLRPAAPDRPSPDPTEPAPRPPSESPPPTAPPPAPSTTSDLDVESTFEVGSSFSDECAVAWPTAPTYTTDSIQMRMSCLGTPNQFLFVDVAYGDRDLPVTPSTGFMEVSGEVIDITDNGLFRTLVVIAERIEL